MSETKQAIARGGIGLAIFATVTAGLIAATQVLTAERIDREVQQAKSRALFTVLPQTLQTETLLENAFDLPGDLALLGYESAEIGYRVIDEGQVEALILPWKSPAGYSGAIEGIVALEREGRILGVQITRHKETPGLGDQVERRKSDWVLGFDGHTLESPADGWGVKKDGGHFDQITGATITPRAIVKAVENSLNYYEQHKPALLAEESAG